MHSGGILNSHSAKTEAVNSLLGRLQFLASALIEVVDDKVVHEIGGQDFTLAQLQLLRLVNAKGDHSIGSLASHIGVSSPAISKTVEKLVRRSFLSRVDREHNRRVVHLSLTKKGHRLLSRFDEARQKKFEDIFRDLSVNELHSAAELLQRISARIVDLGVSPDDKILPRAQKPSPPLREEA